MSVKVKEVDIYIDSKNRNKFYKNILTEDIYYLDKNPISVTKNSNQLQIYIPNHNLIKDDLVIIENVISENINDTFNIYLDTNRLKIDISKYIQTFRNFLEYDIIFNISSNKIFNSLNVNVIKSNISIEIEEFTYLIINLNTNYISTINLEILDLTFIFKDFNNIKLKNINANYPIDENHANGYQIISNTIQNYIFISTYNISINNGIFGGNNIMINKINFQEKGYENSNYFEINLFKVFYNVISIRMISSYFPENINIISENLQTNKLSWIDEEKNSYSILLDNSNDILNTIIEKINGTQISNTNYTFYLKSQIKGNDFFELNVYSKIILYEALSKLTILSNQTELLLQRINVYFPNHNLQDGDEILLENVISFEGIPENMLNTTHIITKIDNNNVYFSLTAYNIKQSTISNKNNGGKTIFLLIKKKIKFNENNLLKRLGIEQYDFSEQIKNRYPIQLYPSYFYIKTVINNGDECLNNFTNKGLNNILSKKYLNKNYVKNEINSNLSLKFDPPINSLYKIIFSMEYDDANLVDFYNIDNNFVLRISFLV